MDQVVLSILLMALLFVLLGSGMWIALSLLAVGIVGMALVTPAPVGKILATTTWGASGSWTLVSLPLFLWMGEILFRTRLSEHMFIGLAPWLNWLPGRLVHINVVGCGIFAAVSGSSSATCATIGRMSLPELRRLGYDERMSIGTLAGSGTLGILIPPSIALIIYGVVAGVSIPRLFIAGILPGIVLMLMFMGYVAAWAILRPDKTPRTELKMTLAERFYRVRLLVPVMLLIVAVLGSIYAGFATATEAAAVGVAGALLLSAASGSLTGENFAASVMGATRTSCMIGFIVTGAAFLSTATGVTGIPQLLATWVGSLGLSVYTLIFVLTLFFIVLGCFLEGVSMIVLTISVLLPVVQQAGIDLVWFGVYIVVVIEMSLITPPVGINLFVLQGMTGRDILYVTRASLPFFFIMNAMVVIITVYPELVLYLPGKMLAR
ncbi:MAG: TRAP transporter large permease [Pseudomonadota bacterium]